MKRKLIATVAIVCLLLCSVWTYNRFLAYAWHYNIANMYCKPYTYDKALEHYQKALEKKIPEGKECRIRVNLALTMTKVLGPDYAEPDQIDSSIKILEGAKNYLLADNCATEEGTGHSEVAEQLKEEIEKILEELYKQQGGGEGEDPEGGSPEDVDPEEMDVKEQNIREQLTQMQEKANLDRESDRQFMKEYDYETIFNYEGDIW